MILTFAEDFTSTVSLDNELTGTPDSGLYLNRGVHPVITLNNLLMFLPNVSLTPSTYSEGTTYNKFSNSRKRSDLVTYNNVIYESLTDSNLANTPGTDSNWLATNLESVRIKSFLWSVEDNFISALSLNRKLIENQYIYNVGETLQTLSGDYIGWCFEPKRSDYVKIRINQIALQANTDTEVSLYVINQGQLITTLTLNPNNGILEFEDVNYTIYGKGRFFFVIDSQEVKSENAFNDPFKYSGFTCYPITGTGETPQSASYAESSFGNGLNFNVSCYLDSNIYITNNKIDFAKFYQSQFEYDVIRMILHNANNRSNIDEQLQSSGINRQILATESLNIDMATVARNYKQQREQATKAVNKTFDKFLHTPKGLKIKRKVV